MDLKKCKADLKRQDHCFKADVEIRDHKQYNTWIKLLSQRKNISLMSISFLCPEVVGKEYTELFNGLPNLQYFYLSFGKKYPQKDEYVEELSKFLKKNYRIKVLWLEFGIPFAFFHCLTTF